MESSALLIGNELKRNLVELSSCAFPAERREVFMPQLILNSWLKHTATHN